MQIPTLFITLIACAPKSNETTTVATVSDVPKQDEPSQQEYNIELDGVKIQARWDDGDTFSAYTKDGDTKKKDKSSHEWIQYLRILWSCTFMGKLE